MARRFPQHQIRPVTPLDGTWDFAFLGDADPDQVDLAALGFDDVMAVPGCYDATPKYAGRRGLAAYRTRVRTSAGLQRLVFGAVQHWCRVYWNGELIREHAGGFTRFWAETESADGEAEVVVLVDNRFDERSPLHMEHFDWYAYGGISRGVELHRLEPLHIDGLKIDTLSVAERRVQVRIDYTGVQAGPAALGIECDGRAVSTETVDLDASGSVTRTLDIPWLAAWSSDEPRLSTLTVTLGEDDMSERFGLREVATANGRITVNGEPVRLLGVNRHEAHPQFGHAQPEALLVNDVQQLQDLGANFVRGSHYPLDPLFLDLCDEAGIMVWCESIGWQYPVEHLTDPAFVEAQLAHIEAMCAAAQNHPSIILWGILNECPSWSEEGYPVYAALLGRLRELDPHRPVTYAAINAHDDKCFDLVDVVSANTYPGWYFGDVPGIPAELDRISAHVDALGFADKPLIISEIGAGAVPGWNDSHGSLWTEDYQAELLTTVVDHVMDGQDRISGLAIWVLGDFKTSELRRLALTRPRGVNDKGIIDEYRRPKQAFRAVRERFRRKG
ncbi:glycoside hydrolase family 2 protein [Glycomyces tritici]|uniref:Glycoside hydrolase family 2 TIM barrel-domain containing protein n=1 Tax=Glycomyces tritici TaxID=2665176 RepID=A0ABT7YKM2_9ACTN|nr:glycoside hydrolase family 2 TIM barrel-domain containing protein [Glycomyces tritici]MDN3239189.1 glycoside hydrolase family 2 TIM barrel-domain containing protein [Glycomyces tritici]